MAKKKKRAGEWRREKGGEIKSHRGKCGKGFREVQEELVTGRGLSNVLWGIKDSLPFGFSVNSEVGQKLENGSHTSVPMPSASAFLHYRALLQLALAIDPVLTDEREKALGRVSLPK